MQLSDWLELAGDAARELAQIALGADQVAFVRVPGAPPAAHLQGVVLPLFSEDVALQLALLAERSDCTALARWFLGLGANEPFDSDSDVLDAMGEFTQLIARRLQARLAGKRELRRGVALGLRGPASPLGEVRSIEGVLEIEDSLFWLVLTAPPDGGEP